MSEFTIVNFNFNKNQAEQIEEACEAIFGEGCVEHGVELPLHGYAGDIREQRVDMRIRQEFVNRVTGGSSNDIGFAHQADGTTDLIIDRYTQRKASDLTDRIRAETAYRVAKATAEAAGFEIEEETVEEDGSRRLRLARWQ